MPIHLTFNNIRNSDAVTEHVHHAFEELIKITDDKFPFHVTLNKVAEESYHVGINCSYRNKSLSSKADHENLYKALSKGIDSMKTQVIRKAEKVRAPHCREASHRCLHLQASQGRGIQALTRGESAHTDSPREP